MRKIHGGLRDAAQRRRLLGAAVLLLLVSGLVGAQKPSPGKGGSDGAKKSELAEQARRFRVVLTGFTVNHQTNDNILESDGKGDEVFIAAEVAQFDNYSNNSSYEWRQRHHYGEVPPVGDFLNYVEGLNGAGNITYRRSLTSIVMGDAENQEAPRIKAGTVDLSGGLGTGDRFPTNQPWNLTGTPSANRLPMLLWEGEFRANANDLVIIVPTIWEWDDGNFRTRRAFTEAADKYFNIYTQNAGGFFFSSGERDIAGAGDRPIGWAGSPRGIKLNRGTAAQAAIDSPAKRGPGVLELVYAYEDGSESYSLFIKIERLS